MSGKTRSELSVADSRMWRRLLARAHPDSGGDHELFVWTQSVREVVERHHQSPAKDLIEEMISEWIQKPPEPRKPRKKKPWSERRSKNRIPFETDLTFDELTARALKTAKELAEPYERIFSLLVGCEAPAADEGPEAAAEAQTGAGYAVLADVGRALGLDKRGRYPIYRHSEEVSLTHRHARYLLREAERLSAESPDLAEEIKEAALCRKA